MVRVDGGNRGEDAASSTGRTLPGVFQVAGGGVEQPSASGDERFNHINEQHTREREVGGRRAHSLNAVGG